MLFRSDVHSYPGWPLIIATVFFAFQIYCDFSGYSDIAVGIARVLGFQLMTNFDRPYFSRSISEFWKRWHISLTSWFKDYVYIPMGGNRVTKGRWYFNLLFVFLLSGFWHGANWTFVIWGALNGLYLIGAIFTAPLRYRVVKAIGLDRRPDLHSMVRVGTTFLLICFSWIFFRAQNVSDAWYVLTHMGSGLGDGRVWEQALQDMGLHARGLWIAWVGIIALLAAERWQGQYGSLRRYLSLQPAAVRFCVYSFMAGGILVLGRFSSQQFIYFQF